MTVRAEVVEKLAQVPGTRAAQSLPVGADRASSPVGRAPPDRSRRQEEGQGRSSCPASPFLVLSGQESLVSAELQVTGTQVKPVNDRALTAVLRWFIGHF